MRPNCKSFEADDGRVYIEARRTIPMGEELTYDYRLSLDGRITRKIRESYACHCGARRCRGSLLLRNGLNAPVMPRCASGGRVRPGSSRTLG